MSEYQYYEFLAIDKPLGERELKELRSVSSRARITATSFVNTYNWGDLKANPLNLMAQYFDAFLYTANWGTRRFALRLPRSLMDAGFLQQYQSDSLTITEQADWTIVDFCARETDPGYWSSGEGWMTLLAPIRADLLAGDSRSLYLGWLLGVQFGEFEDDDISPPVPPGLTNLSGSLSELTEFLEIDFDLISAAAKWSGNSDSFPPSREELSAWVFSLPTAEKDSLLEKFIQDESLHLRAELLKRFREEYRNKPENQTDTADRPFPTVGQLLREADELRAERESEETERRNRERKKKEEEAAAERRRYLDNLAAREEETWSEIESLVSTKQTRKYDQACQLLKDLFDLSAEQGNKAAFAARIQDLRIRHRRKKSFIDRLNQAGLPSASPFQDKASDL